MALGVKNPPANAREVRYASLIPREAGLIPGSGRSPGEGHGNPLQYSFLGNPMDRGAWQAIIHGFAQRLTHHNNSRVKYYYDSHFPSEET